VRWTQGDIAIVVIVRHEVACCALSIKSHFFVSHIFETGNKNESYLPSGAFSCCDGWIQERERCGVCVCLLHSKGTNILYYWLP
jgi:hypothetical protein